MSLLLRSWKIRLTRLLRMSVEVDLVSLGQLSYEAFSKFDV